MKKVIGFVLTLSLLITALALPDFNAFAETASLSQNESVSMQRLMELGILSSGTVTQADLNRAVTREELAKILVLANGQQESLSLYKNSSMFSDVPASRWSNPYIQAAVKQGYMSQMPDGKFHPTEKVNFAQAATILGRLLKYNETNLTGSYPQNYFDTLSDLGVLDGISYTAAGTVTRGQIALMIYRLFDTAVYGGQETFANTLSTCKSAVVLENSVINTNEDARKLVTDKGTFYLKTGVAVPEAGKRYIFRMENKEIAYAAPSNLEFKALSVRSMSNGVITANDGEKVTLPAGITFYYQGKESSYDAVSSSIQANSSVIIGYDGTEAVYGALFDPLYSQPEVITADKAGTPLEIKYRNTTIEREGKYITPSQIEVNDVVYKVSDIWGKYSYVIVYSNTVSGTITAILPSKISPKSIEIDGKAYTLSGSFPKEKLNSSGVNQVGETARILLGSDGNVVDIISDAISSANNYALVLNAYSKNSVNSSDFGKTYYYVTLLLSDGGKKTYRVNTAQDSLRGKLVTCEITASGPEYDTVSLTGIESNASGSYAVNKDERMIGDSYVANGAALFNITNAATTEIEASVIAFGDLPAGTLTDGKIKVILKSGDFQDINIMLLNDALDQNVAYGLVTAKKSSGKTDPLAGQTVFTETITMLVNGQTMTYTTGESGLYVGSVARVRLSGGSVAAADMTLSAEASGSEIEAVDSSRIRLNGKVYSYHNDLAIYRQTGDTTWKQLSSSDLTKGAGNGSITLYLDKPVSYGGKVVMILLR